MSSEEERERDEGRRREGDARMGVCVCRWSALFCKRPRPPPPPKKNTPHNAQCTCRQNMDDALQKLQEIIDAAVEAVTPKEADPETIARVKKK